jgi:hypothetical protein
MILRAVNPYKQEVAGSSPALPTIYATIGGSFGLIGQPENRPGIRGRPRFHDDRIPNCGLAGMTNRYAALPVARRRACQPNNSDGACHPTNTRLIVPRHIRCRRDTRHDHGHGRGPGPGPSRLDRLRPQSRHGNRDLPRHPCYPIPSCSLPCRRNRYAVSPAEPGLVHSMMVCATPRGTNATNAATIKPR